MGNVVLDESIETAVERLLNELPDTEFRPAVEKLLRDSWRPGYRYGDAFARMITGLLGDHGLILLDPLDPELKKLAAPLYAEAARRSHEIAVAVEKRSRELEAAGYHAQVVASENSFPLFLLDDKGARHALMRTDTGKYQAKEGSDEQKPDRKGGPIQRPNTPQKSWRSGPRASRKNSAPTSRCAPWSRTTCCPPLPIMVARLRSLTSRRLPRSIVCWKDRRRLFSLAPA